MKLLLDTHTLLWALGFERKLPAQIKRMLESATNQVHFSAANLLEVATKRSVGRRHRLSTDSHSVLEAALRAGYAFVPIDAQHAVAVETIANFHGDPVDRLLLAQSQVEDMRLVTHDEELAAYDFRMIFFSPAACPGS